MLDLVRMVISERRAMKFGFGMSGQVHRRRVRVGVVLQFLVRDQGNAWEGVEGGRLGWNSIFGFNGRFDGVPRFRLVVERSINLSALGSHP